MKERDVVAKLMLMVANAYDENRKDFPSYADGEMRPEFTLEELRPTAAEAMAEAQAMLKSWGSRSVSDESKKLISLSEEIRAKMSVPKKESWLVSVPFVIRPKAVCEVSLWMFNTYRLESMVFGLPSGLTAAVSFAARDDMEDVFARKLIEDEREAHDEHPAQWYATMPPFKTRSPHYKIVVSVKNQNKWIVNTKIDFGGNLIPGMNIHGMKWIAFVDGLQAAEKRSHTIEEVDRTLDEALSSLPKR